MTGPVKLSQLNQLYWQGLEYGPPGVGKTIFATNTQRWRICLFDVDQGWNAIKQFRMRNGISDENVDVFTIAEVSDWLPAWTWFGQNYSRYGLMVLDSLTELQRKFHRVNMATIQNKKQAWGRSLEQIEELMDATRKLPMHVVYTAHEWKNTDMDNKVKEGEDDSLIQTWRPSLKGRAQTEYDKHLGWLARMQNAVKINPNGEREVIRVLNFGPDTNLEYKDRSGFMSQYEPCDFDYMIDKMDGKFWTPNMPPPVPKSNISPPNIGAPPSTPKP